MTFENHEVAEAKAALTISWRPKYRYKDSRTHSLILAIEALFIF